MEWSAPLTGAPSSTLPEQCASRTLAPALMKLAPIESLTLRNFLAWHSPCAGLKANREREARSRHQAYETSSAENISQTLQMLRSLLMLAL